MFHIIPPSTIDQILIVTENVHLRKGDNMDPKAVKEINKRVDDLVELVIPLEKLVNRLSMHSGEYMKANKPIPPGTFPKIGYDTKGLIIKGMLLEPSDIPDLPIEKITGLKKSIGNILSEDDIQDLKDILRTKLEKNEDIKPGVAIKVIFDEKGLITSTSELLSSDIPQLAVSHIDGLDDRLKVLEGNPGIEPSTEPFSVNPGTFTKITYDSNGRVIGGERLIENDIPLAVLNRISWLESKVPSMTSQTLLEDAIIELKKMVVGNDPIAPGTYTKVTVDSKGLVTKGSKLSMKDLPTIGIGDIVDLQTTLLKKVDYKDLTSIRNQISILQNNNLSSDIIEIRNQLVGKLDQDNLNVINNDITRLRRTVESLSERMPHELISEQIQQIMNNISTLSGRIHLVEQRLGIEKQGEAI